VLCRRHNRLGDEVYELNGRLEAIPIMGEAITKTIEKFYDNSLENIGRGNSWTYLGPQWAQAATAPSRMYKSESWPEIRLSEQRGPRKEVFDAPASSRTPSSVQRTMARSSTT
jgi:hypothetical protein